MNKEKIENAKKVLEGLYITNAYNRDTKESLAIAYALTLFDKVGARDALIDNANSLIDILNEEIESLKEGILKCGATVTMSNNDYFKMCNEVERLKSSHDEPHATVEVMQDEIDRLKESHKSIVDINHKLTCENLELKGRVGELKITIDGQEKIIHLLEDDVEVLKRKLLAVREIDVEEMLLDFYNRDEMDGLTEMEKCLAKAIKSKIDETIGEI